MRSSFTEDISVRIVVTTINNTEPIRAGEVSSA